MASIAKFYHGHIFRWQSYGGRTIRVYTAAEKIIGTVNLPGTDRPTPTRVARWVELHGASFIRSRPR